MSSRGLLVCVALATANLTCGNPLDLCPPIENQLRFFSRGDCVVTRASFFSGHEWLTFFGNRDLPERRRFSQDEIDAIIEGNRRVDWPKELLVHLNNSPVAYLNALVAHTDRAEIQPIHFLLNDVNTTPEAAAEAYRTIEGLTREAVESWAPNRERALTSIGQALHAIQDSFSPAHTRRDASRALCIMRVKAFMPRREGSLTADVEFHGQVGEEGGTDTIGHTTVDDSIYREGRDCHDPQTSAEVEACLDEPAQNGRRASRDYLEMMQDLLGSNAHDALISARMAEYIAAHLALCT